MFWYAPSLAAEHHISIYGHITWWEHKLFTFYFYIIIMQSGLTCCRAQVLGLVNLHLRNSQISNIKLKCNTESREQVRLLGATQKTKKLLWKHFSWLYMPIHLRSLTFSSPRSPEGEKGGWRSINEVGVRRLEREQGIEPIQRIHFFYKVLDIVDFMWFTLFTF